MQYVARVVTWTPELKAAGLVPVLVMTDLRPRVDGWVRATAAPFAVLVDESRKLSRQFGVYKMLGFDSFRMARPSAFIIDRAARVRHAVVFRNEQEGAPPLEEYLRVARSL
jgi:peroxiredoxin